MNQRKRGGSMEDDKIEQALEKAMTKESKKTKTKTRRKKNNFKLWEELNEKHLKELGYIK